MENAIALIYVLFGIVIKLIKKVNEIFETGFVKGDTKYLSYTAKQF